MKNNWINTHSGIRFAYEEFSPSDLMLEDMFRAISMICRFAGHTAHFYSVGEHSLRVAELLPYELRVYGLLHDCSEAYMSDIPKPLKMLCPGYQKIETEVQNAIYSKFANGPLIGEAMEALNKADVTALRWEAHHLISGQGRTWGCWNGIPAPRIVPPDCLSPEDAEQELWDMWDDLWN